MEEKITHCNVSIVKTDYSNALPNILNSPHEDFDMKEFLNYIYHIFKSVDLPFIASKPWMVELKKPNDRLCKVPHQRSRKLRHKLVSKHINKLK
jgi:hypothetical protein|nr:MAG TPA: hypothetical protein [Caudoviricetes sp.]